MLWWIVLAAIVTRLRWMNRFAGLAIGLASRRLC